MTGVNSAASNRPQAQPQIARAPQPQIARAPQPQIARAPQPQIARKRAPTHGNLSEVWGGSEASDTNVLWFLDCRPGCPLEARPVAGLPAQRAGLQWQRLKHTGRWFEVGARLRAI